MRAFLGAALASVMGLAGGADAQPPARLLARAKAEGYHLEEGPCRAVKGRFQKPGVEAWVLLVRQGNQSCLLAASAFDADGTSVWACEPRDRFLRGDGLLRRISIPTASRREGLLSQLAWQHPEAVPLFKAAKALDILEEQHTDQTVRLHVWVKGQWRSFTLAD